MLRDSKDFKIVLGTTTTQDLATVSMTTGLGLSAAEAAGVAGAEIVNGKATGGVLKACVAKVAVSGTNLVITEGSDAFVTGDEYIVRLYWGLPSATATMSTAS